MDILSNSFKTLLFNDPLFYYRIKEQLEIFETVKQSYKDFYVGFEDELKNHFLMAIIYILIYLNPDKIKFTLTDSKSIFFRIFIGNYEISFEVFYTKDYEEDNVEVVYSVYKYDDLILQSSGKIGETIPLLHGIICTNNNLLSVTDTSTSTNLFMFDNCKICNTTV